MSAALPDATELDAAWAVVREHLAPSPITWRDGVAYKREDLLPTGAFKVRGALSALDAARRRGVERVVVASAGNHGAGIAWASHTMGMRATILVPAGCPAVKREKMARYAEVVVCDTPGYDETEAVARERAAREGVPFVSPFDDTAVMAGNGGTLGRELAEELPEIGTLFVPVGGAGLVAGLICAFERVGRAPRIVTSQSVVSPAYARSLADGTVYTTWPPAESLAEGLEGGTGATGVRVGERYGVEALEVEEDAIGAAMVDLSDGLGAPVEGSAAVAEVARKEQGHRFPTPHVVLVTGGNVDPARLDALRAQHAR